MATDVMRRGWVTYGLVAGLVGLLVVLGVFQYRWLRRISESDGEKAHQLLQQQTESFAKDFDKEIQNAYFNFQTDAESWKTKDWQQFNERYDFWRQKAAHPDLITDFYFFEASGGGPMLKYDSTSRTFVSVDPSPELLDLKAATLDPKTFRAVYKDGYSLVLPVQAAMPETIHRRVSAGTGVAVHEMQIPERYGFEVVKLDPEVIRNKVLPELTAKYFGDGDYRASVVTTDGQPVFGSVPGGTPDAERPLFDMTPDNLIFFASRDLMSSIEGDKHESTEAKVIVNSHVENRTFNKIERTKGGSKVMQLELKAGDARPRKQVFSTQTTSGQDGGPWTLQVRHSSGSLDNYIAGTFRRNLALGFGMLFLLAGAIGAILVTSLRAKRLAQRQVDFVSSVSHEFRTPLAVICSAGENLADGVAKEDMQVSRYGSLIKSEGRKLSSMVEQILDFAGANSGKRKFSFGRTAIEDVVNDAVDDCRRSAEEKGLEIRTNVTCGIAEVSADRTALTQAIQNLIANAIKYSNGSSRVTVAAKNGGSKVRISVEDSGIGISARDLKHVFEPFFRSKEVVDSQIHGNGLGLSIVKQIVDAHSGTILAESELGKGSKFTIELPTSVNTAE